MEINIFKVSWRDHTRVSRDENWISSKDQAVDTFNMLKRDRNVFNVKLEYVTVDMPTNATELCSFLNKNSFIVDSIQVR
jgi:hypothetical protein